MLITTEPNLVHCLKNIYESDREQGISFTQIHIRVKDVSSLLEEAINNKIFPKIFETVSSVHPVEQKYFDFYEKYKCFRKENFRVMKTLEEFNSQYIVLKGAGIEQYYPSHCERYSHDLDICVYSQEVFFEINKFLLKSKLEQNSTMLLSINTKTRKVQGMTRLDPSDDLEYFEGVEIQIGAFPMTHRTSLPWDVFMKNKVIYPAIKNTIIPTPDRQGNFLIYLAEIISRSKLTLRDLFDIKYILKDSEHFDLEFIVRTIEKFDLTSSVMIVKDTFESVPGFDSPITLNKLVNKLNTKKLPKKTNHVRNFLKINSNKFIKDYLFYKIRDYTLLINDKDKFLSLLKQTDNVFSPKHFYSNGTFVYFMKLNEIESTDKWIKVKNFTINLTPIGSYLVCMHALYSDEELEEANNLVINLIMEESNLDGYVISK